MASVADKNARVLKPVGVGRYGRTQARSNPVLTFYLDEVTPAMLEAILDSDIEEDKLRELCLSLYLIGAVYQEKEPLVPPSWATQEELDDAISRLISKGTLKDSDGCLDLASIPEWLVDEPFCNDTEEKGAI